MYKLWVSLVIDVLQLRWDNPIVPNLSKHNLNDSNVKFCPLYRILLILVPPKTIFVTLFPFQALKLGRSTFNKLEMMLFIARMCHLATASPVELRCEFLLRLITETNHQRYTILLLFGLKMSQQAASRSVSSKGAEALLLTPPSIGLHSKVPNQEFFTERQVLAFLQLGQNAITWLFLRYDHAPGIFL